MSYQPIGLIKTPANAIADIHIRDTGVPSEPRAIGEILRPFLLELRRSRTTGEPMRQDILDRFCAPVSTANTEHPARA